VQSCFWADVLFSDMNSAFPALRCDSWSLGSVLVVQWSSASVIAGPESMIATANLRLRGYGVVWPALVVLNTMSIVPHDFGLYVCATSRPRSSLLRVVNS
jgi:hypothetical protein